MDINSVNVFYDIEYNSYKKKLMRDIFVQVDTLFNIFDKDFNDNMIKLFILYKKNKIKNDNMKYLIIFLYDFVVELSNLEHMDQNEFLNLIIKFFKIYCLLLNVGSDIKVGKIEQEVLQYINWEILNNKVVTCMDELKKTNKILEGLVELNNYNPDDDSIHQNIKPIIIKLAGYLAYDFFMYYTSTEIHKIIYKKLSVNSDANNKLNKLGVLFIKYKKYFTQEYRTKLNLYKEIYDEILKCNISKYKLNIANIDFKELIKELVIINNKI